MAGDDTLVRQGPEPVPFDVPVPQGGELLPKVVRATIDGSGAGAAFYAAVQVLDPNNNVKGTYVSPQIAAGASADVTWFRGLAQQASSGGTGTVSWVHLHNIAVSVPSRSTPHTLLDFTTFVEYTNDASLFAIVPGNGLTINGAGFYAVSVSCIFAGQIAAGSAEAVFNISGTGNEIDCTDTFMKPDFAGGTAICTMSEGFMLDNTGSQSGLSLIQTSGVTATVSCEVSVARLTSDPGDF